MLNLEEMETECQGWKTPLVFLLSLEYFNVNPSHQALLQREDQHVIKNVNLEHIEGETGTCQREQTLMKRDDTPYRNYSTPSYLPKK